jgi:hypothetical protein
MNLAMYVSSDSWILTLVPIAAAIVLVIVFRKKGHDGASPSKTIAPDSNEKSTTATKGV